jgi:hypothetical protein
VGTYPTAAIDLIALLLDAANCLKLSGPRNICGVRIMRTFVWSDERPDDTDEIPAAELEQHVRYQGVLFQLRTSDTPHPAGEQRVTKAIYDEAQKSGTMDLGLARAK